MTTVNFRCAYELNKLNNNYSFQSIDRTYHPLTHFHVTLLFITYTIGPIGCYHVHISFSLFN